jgi:hypothetical protein
MALLDDVKKFIGVSTTVKDTEILDLIESAKAELSNVGINVDKFTDLGEIDPLIKRAIKLYCKPDFVNDNNEAQRYIKSYEMLKIHLALSADYQVVVTDV